MAKKAGMSEVKFKVRYNALFLREFTVAEMVRATGLKPESVRTELQRMRREGLLTSEPLTEKRRGRRGRPALYKLTSDPEKRLALSRSVRAFYPAPPRPTRPTSRHYLVATRLLDRVMTGYYDDWEKDTALQEARDHLEFAWYDEGEPQGLIRAYIDRERARLEYLAGNDQTAEALFQQVREVFTSAELSDEVAKVDEYLACIQIRRRWMQLRKEALSPQEQARAALETLHAVPRSPLADRPLAALLKKMLEIESERWRFNLAIVRIPVLGAIAAGEPIPVPEENLSPLNYEVVELTQDIVKDQGDLYALRVKGDSMIDALINDGDIVIIRYQAEVENGEMAAVWLLDRGETTLKRVYREGDHVRLQPANPNIEPIYARPAGIRIQGKVIAVLRQL